MTIRARSGSKMSTCYGCIDQHLGLLGYALRSQGSDTVYEAGISKCTAWLVRLAKKALLYIAFGATVEINTQVG